MVFCKYCGNNISDSSRFCIKCGKPQIPAAPAAPVTPASYSPAKQGKSSSNTGLIVVIVILCIALLVALAVIFLPMLTQQPPENNGQLNLDTGKGDEFSQPEETTGERVLSAGNPYEACYQRYDAYILPSSDSSYLCYSDIDNLTDEERHIAAQEIYARQGQRFSDPEVQEYFDHRAWYTPGGSFQANSYEQANLDLLEVYEAVQDGSWEYSGNPYIQVFNGTGEYANPHSNTRYLTANELKDLSAIQLELMRNEIFARRGFLFGDQDLRMYFYSKPWYQPTIPGAEFDSSVFNKYEYHNAKLILLYEKKERGVQFSSDNPYRQYYSTYRDYVIYDSDVDYLTARDLSGMTADELCLARNEILARHGYTFKDEHLLEYFLQFDWYLPNTPEGDGSSIKYNSVEQDNIDLLLETEKALRNKPDLSNLDRTLNYTVSCNAFSITLPNYFKQYANLDTSGSSIGCCENVSSPTYDGYTGFLFKINLTTDNDYTYLPEYRYLGILEDEGGNQYTMYVYFPTDVRWTDAAQEIYQKMWNEGDRIFSTVKGINGFTFIPD